MNPPRIRIVIDEVRMRGIASGDAQRLLDTLTQELTRLAPEIAAAAGARRAGVSLPSAASAPLPAPRRIETAGTSIAGAIVKAITP